MPALLAWSWSHVFIRSPTLKKYRVYGKTNTTHVGGSVSTQTAKTRTSMMSAVKTAQTGRRRGARPSSSVMSGGLQQRGAAWSGRVYRICEESRTKRAALGCRNRINIGQDASVSSTTYCDEAAHGG